MKNTIILNFEKDNEIDVTDLPSEFRNFSPLFFKHAQNKDHIAYVYELKKAYYDEIKSQVYVDIKRTATDKPTADMLKALVDIDPNVKKARQEMMEAKKDRETAMSYVESLRAKKDMIIQLGADARKE